MNFIPKQIYFLITVLTATILSFYFAGCKKKGTIDISSFNCDRVVFHPQGMYVRITHLDSGAEPGPGIKMDPKTGLAVKGGLLNWNDPDLSKEENQLWNECIICGLDKMGCYQKDANQEDLFVQRDQRFCTEDKGLAGEMMGLQKCGGTISKAGQDGNEAKPHTQENVESELERGAGLERI